MTAIYLITDGIHHKIGISNNPEKRLAQLQTGHPRQLSIVALGWRSDRATAQFVEGLIHKGLNQHRKKGEWFLIPDRLIATVQREITA